MILLRMCAGFGYRVHEGFELTLEVVALCLFEAAVVFRVTVQGLVPKLCWQLPRTEWQIIHLY